MSVVANPFAKSAILTYVATSGAAGHALRGSIVSPEPRLWVLIFAPNHTIGSLRPRGVRPKMGYVVACEPVLPYCPVTDLVARVDPDCLGTVDFRM